MKKIFTLIAPVLMAAALFANGQEEKGSGPAGDEGNFNRTGFPLVNEPVTLTIACSKHGQQNDVEAIPLFQEYLKKTNVNVVLDISPGSGWQEKRNLILASGDIPDIMGHLGEVDLAINAKQGVFEPLNSYLDEGLLVHSQRIYEMRPEYKKAMTLPDGKIYSFVKINELPFRESPNNPFINKAWLDRLGLDMPESLEELTQVLIAFRDQDANGNGDPNDEIPLSFKFGTAATAYSAMSLLSAWGICDNGDNRLVVNKGKVEFEGIKDEYKEGMKWFAMLWAEDLIDYEAFTYTEKEYFARGKSGDESLYGVYFSWLIESPTGPERAKEYVTLPPLPYRKNGPAPVWNRMAGQYLDRSRAVVSATSEHKQVALRFLDELLEERLTLEWARGPFGLVMEEQPDGSITYPDPPEGLSANAFRYTYAPWILNWAVLKEEYSRMDMGEANNRKIHEDYPMLIPFLNPVENTYPQVFYTTEESEELSILNTDIHNYMNRMIAGWITGKDDVDATWSEYKSNLDKMGLDKFLTIHQAAYDRYVK